MDVFAHGLWAGAAGMAANRKLTRKVRLAWAMVWGVFPDVFAFLPMFAVLVQHRFFGQDLSPRLLFNRAFREALPGFLWPEGLYRVSHSLVVFSVVFALVWLLARRPALAMLAWPLHVLMDIPTHGSGVYRTPFVWPLSSYRLSGIWWSERWFMILNYSAIAAAYLALLIWILVARRQRKRQEREAIQ